jgi:hypothetical protein
MIGNPGDEIIVITAPHFVAGVCLQNDTVVRAAPILKYMVGWHFTKIEEYVAKKHWKWEIGLRAA